MPEVVREGIVRHGKSEFNLPIWQFRSGAAFEEAEECLPTRMIIFRGHKLLPHTKKRNNIAAKRRQRLT